EGGRRCSVLSHQSRRVRCVGQSRERPGRTMNVLHIIKPGMLTTVQDLGRWGLQARGVPVAGPMDPVSHRIANAIVGNPIGAATLEVTLLGPEFVIDEGRAIAVAGAEFDVSAGGQPIPPRTRIVIPAKT